MYPEIICVGAGVGAHQNDFNDNTHFALITISLIFFVDIHDLFI